MWRRLLSSDTTPIFSAWAGETATVAGDLDEGLMILELDQTSGRSEGSVREEVVVRVVVRVIWRAFLIVVRSSWWLAVKSQPLS